MGKRGRIPVTYTVERALLVRQRVLAGERITAVCKDLGMDHCNFCRWCRRNDFQVHTPASRQQVMRQPKGPYSLGQKCERLREPRPGGRAEAIVGALRAGQAPRAVAALHGVGYVYVLRLRKLTGLNPPAGPGRNIVSSTRVFRVRESVLSDLRTGLPVMQIAARHHLSPQRIYQIRNKYLKA